MPQPVLKETDLYPPIKSLLERQGYEVKGEVGAADVVAVRGADAPVIVELKTGFSLSLFHQAVERQKITDAVYVAVPRRPGKSFIAMLRKNKALCRRLGLGLITVRMKDRHVEIHVDPAPYKPRQMKGKKTKLLKEFSKRVGDPNVGGSTRRPLMTAYRQDALCCLNCLQGAGPMKAAIVAEQSGVERARRIMSDNHYGWFERIQTGIYGLSPNGYRAAIEYAGEIARMQQADL